MSQTSTAGPGRIAQVDDLVAGIIDRMTADPVAAAERMSTVRALLVADYPWFGTLALRLHFRPAPWIETLGTDGTRLLYAPAFVLKQSMPELLGGVAHEVMHCGLLHPFRFNARDAFQWNVACDYAINQILVDAGLTLPKGSLIDPQYAGMSAEEIYLHRRGLEQETDEPERRIDEGWGPPSDPDGDEEEAPGPDPQKPNDDADDDAPAPDGETDDQGETGTSGTREAQTGSKPRPGRPVPGDDSAVGEMLPAGAGKTDPGKEPGDDQADGDGDGDQDGEGPGDGSGPEQEMTPADWQVATAQATMTATKAGKLPGSAVRAAQVARQSQTPWREILRDFVTNAQSDDYTWTSPNRRFIGRGLYLPGMSHDATPRIGILVDTSGSINRDALNAFASEMDSILKETRPEAIDVVYCDAAVAGTAEFTPDGDELTLSAPGGGGTNMEPGFRWFSERADDGYPVACVVCFTDLDFWNEPEEPEAYPVLWATWTGRTGPTYGPTIRIEP